MTAGTAAVPGTYTFTVDRWPRRSRSRRPGSPTPTPRIKEGTFTFRVGSGEATTVTIGPKNNTVQGLADAINTAGGDVRAAVINDGSANPYRLMLTATKTGAANTISVTNSLTDRRRRGHRPDGQHRAGGRRRGGAGSGSGAGAITVSSPTNQSPGWCPASRSP